MYNVYSYTIGISIIILFFMCLKSFSKISFIKNFSRRGYFLFVLLSMT